MPIECSKEDFSVVTDAIKKFINNPEAIVTISIPSETIQKVSTGHIIGFLFFALYLTIVFIGVITEYTTLFNKPNVIHEEHVEKQKTKLGLVFLSFSLTRNVRKIFWGKPAYDDNHLIIFNGIRVLSLMYLIWGQGYISVLQSPLSDLDATDRILQRWPFYMVVGALFAVDVFFLISGFLAAHVLLNKFFQTAWFNIPMIFFHRIYRLVLPIGMIILFVVTFLYFLGDGPIWKAEMQQIIDPWYKKWWEDIFFLWNMIPAPDQSKCLRWLWYKHEDYAIYWGNYNQNYEI